MNSNARSTKRITVPRAKQTAPTQTQPASNKAPSTKMERFTEMELQHEKVIPLIATEQDDVTNFFITFMKALPMDDITTNGTQ